MKQTQSALVVTETVPALDAAAGLDVPSAPPPTEPIPGLLPGMIVVNGVPVKTSASHPIKYVSRKLTCLPSRTSCSFAVLRG